MSISGTNFNLDSVYEAELGKKLAVIEELRSQLGKEGIQCPGVLVIGAQSAGKSSVLERLTGLSFPRGENLCTRFPTIVQLQTSPEITEPIAYVSTDPEFSKSEELSSMESITKEIERCSEEQGADGTTIADRPVHVRFIRSTGPVMTLIDLPGITHVDPSNKDFNIHAATVSIVEDYVKNENMVVLVVIPANDDFGNSEALRIAQKYDENGKRTIGVISKCDLVPANSDIVQKVRMVRENDVKLALGLIAVRNKSPTEEDVDINREEKSLFSTHKVLKNLDPGEWGYNTLSKKIVNLQSAKVCEFIPEVKSLVQRNLFDARKELKALGFVPSSQPERQTIFTSILVELQREIEKLIRAEGKDKETNVATLTLNIAQNFASNVKEEVPDFLSDDYHSHVVGLMKCSSGYTLPNFKSDSLFRNELTTYFYEGNILEKVQEMIDEISELMELVFEKVLNDISSIKPFFQLKDYINEESRRRILVAKDRASEVASAIVHAEKVQLFTQSKTYISSLDNAKASIRSYQHNEFIEKANIELQKYYGKNTSVHFLSNKKHKKPCNRIDNSFIGKHIANSKKDLIEEAAGDFQISMKVYSDVMLHRLFDVLPMVVRSILVNDLVRTLLVDMQAKFNDESLVRLFLEEEVSQRERLKLTMRVQNMQAAQKKLRSIS